jgi:ADP-ribose pyrophosphatase YjhB (NUDIX family)
MAAALGGSFCFWRPRSHRLLKLMTNESQLRWLDWSRRLHAIAQNGLTFALDAYDIERYHAVRQVAAEILAAAAHTEVAEVRDLLSRECGYATPKVDVRGVVFRGGKLLLVQEKADGGWTVPGGWADVGDSPAVNTVREIREESGFETRPIRLLAVWDRSKHPHDPLPFHVYKVFLLCELIGGAARPSIETDAVEFFGRDELPRLSTGRITAGQIQRLFEHFDHPGLPPDFD